MLALKSMAQIDAPAGEVVRIGQPEYGSDIVAEMLRALDVEFAAILPGATFRGLHDSIVNYLGNRQPQLVLTCHEMYTVAMAHGYFKVTGKPMAAIVHDVVGLLNTSMTIFNAWADRVPVLVLGGTGPMDATRRRPWIDWIHTANVQGNLVRDFTKWDDQPGSVEAIPLSLLQAYRLAVTEPGAPVYVCFDVALQEQRLEKPVVIPEVARYRAPAPAAPDPDALREAARLLVQAHLPVALADRVGRNADAVRALVELAELLAMPVIDGGARHNFPTSHPLDFRGDEKGLLKEADVVLGLDMVDLDGALRLPVDPVTRVAPRIGTASQRIVSISLDELIHRALVTDYQALPTVDVPILADTSLALPMLVEECRRRLDAAARNRIEQRQVTLTAREEQLRERQRRQLQQERESRRMSDLRLVSELWETIKREDFVFLKGNPRRVAPGVCQINGPEQNLGDGGGGAVGAGPGVALGSALALKDSGKVAVAIMGDGEFLASASLLWTAAHYRIPALFVVNNNRSYYNDELHQDHVARARGRPVENRWIGQRIEDPEVDLAGLARSNGLHGEGPVHTPEELEAALRRAVQVVKEGGFALVDVRTENR